ncbi:MAG: hypothetical protein KKG47_14855 [Proteobacteria bacterium]|nr:hypothetical protein [Pseudomonadota bacterium]MBU1737284.1 hypothetical protein [Pseudomonadota bacterium]
MISLAKYYNRHRRRAILIVAAVLLLVLNLVRWVNTAYQTRVAEAESTAERVEQYRFNARQIDQLKEELEKNLKVKAQVEKAFFTGVSDEEIASAMQIRIQNLVMKAGLESESIRPTRQAVDRNREGDAGAVPLEEVIIKARLAGTQQQFIDFLSDIYSSQQFFKIESFTLKPYKKAGLKIFIEFKSYYFLKNSE